MLRRRAAGTSCWGSSDDDASPQRDRRLAAERGRRADDVTEARVDNPFFARLWTLLSGHEPESMQRLRRENLAGLSGRVLEVGAGTGTNFAFYPAHGRPRSSPSNPSARLAPLAGDAARDGARSGHGHRRTPSSSTRDPASRSTRWCARWCCARSTIPDGVLRQLFSLLRPGGELRYLEHVASTGLRAPVAAGSPTPRCGRGWWATATPTATPKRRSSARASRSDERPPRVDPARVGADARSSETRDRPRRQAGLA